LTKQRDEIGDEAVDRLDQPGDHRDCEKCCGPSGTETERFLQEKSDRKVREISHPLGKVDDGKD
jgi:hypothetical protein